MFWRILCYVVIVNGIQSVNCDYCDLKTADKLKYIDTNRNGVVATSNDFTVCAINYFDMNAVNQTTFKVTNANGIRSLDLRHNKIDKLEPDTFIEFQMLEKLTLADNFLEMIPNGRFDDLRLLVLLDLSANLITSIAGEAFVELKSLKTLILNDNCLTDVTLNFGISALHEINLSTNFINNFPRLYVQSVGTLNLSNNSMEAVNFEKITTTVESLIVADNKINRIDNYGNNTSNNTNSNNTNTIVKSIRLFNLEGNQLSDVNQVPKLSRALDINLSRNPIDYSTNIRFLKRFENVKRLNLTDTNLTTLEIFQYIDGKQLEELSIARNPLKVDFDVLHNFTQLRHLQFQQFACYKFSSYRKIINSFSHLQALTIHYELSNCKCVMKHKKLFKIFGHVKFATDWGVMCSGVQRLMTSHYLMILIVFNFLIFNYFKLPFCFRSIN